MTYEELLKLLNTYMTKEEIELVNKYYLVALDIYKDMKRLTKEDYICHSIRVSYILAELKMNALTIGCALIHEGITLNKITKEELTEKFGEETASILSSISKISHLKRTLDNTSDKDKYRRIVVGLAENPITLFIKLADRLDNLKTLYVHDKEHINDVVDETEKIYIPIAHRLGIKKMKSELEDLCLKISDPTGYNDVLEKINKDRSELEDLLLKMKDEIVELLNEHNIKFEITYRVKSVRGIYNKLVKGKKWNQIYDLLGLRVLVEKIEECYLVIGLIHSKFRPIPKRFKDYIANPKNNMYQSLHTTVFGVDGTVFEVQVRTYEMNEIAEHGVASHWSYKEKTDGSKTGVLEERLANFRTLIEINEIENNSEFFKNLKTLEKEEMYIFTPKGDIVELPIDSTPIDFAYKIHSEVGNKVESALVNGKIVPLDYKLQDADIVELKTKEGRTPSEAWLKFVKTETAKSRIKSYFNKKEKDKIIETGKLVLIEEIKKRKLNEKEILNEENISKVLKQLKLDTFEELCTSISTLKYTPNTIINIITNETKDRKEELVEKLLTTNVTNNSKNNEIIIAGLSNILFKIAPCCNPIKGEEIVGYVTKGEGVLIHKKDCKNVDLNNKRIIDAKWNQEYSDKYTTILRIYLDSGNDHLVDIINEATKTDINIVSINNKGKLDYTDIYEFVIKVNNLESLNKLITNLNSLEFVSKIER